MSNVIQCICFDWVASSAYMGQVKGCRITLYCRLWTILQRSKELHGSESAVPGGTIPTGRGKESQILNEGVPVGSHDPSLGAADLTRKETRHFSNGFDKQGKAFLTSRRVQSHIPCEGATGMTGAQLDMHHTHTASLERSMAGCNDDRGSKGPGIRPEVSRYPSMDGFMGNGTQDHTQRNDQSIPWSNIAGQGQHMGLVQTSIHNSLPSASHIPSSVMDSREWKEWKTSFYGITEN